MRKFVFISGSKLSSSLKLLEVEFLNQKNFIIQQVSFDQSMMFLRENIVDLVLIDADGNKLEALDLCNQIQMEFKGTKKVFVYLSEANLNEASKFGLLNAEVEDQETIMKLPLKLGSIKYEDFNFTETTISICSLYGGLGASSMLLLLSYLLGQYQKNSLILESSNNFSIKYFLNLNTNLALLDQDRASRVKHSLDLNWLNNFVVKPKAFPYMHYLNLFNSLEARLNYFTKYIDSSQLIIDEIKDLEALFEEYCQSQNSFKAPYLLNDIKSMTLNINNNLQYLQKDLSGKSFDLFDEVIGLGSQLAKIFLFDLSTDLDSSLNRQLLHLSKYLIVLFRDDDSLIDIYRSFVDFAQQNYSCTLIPVLVSGNYQYDHYQSVPMEIWHSTIGVRPLIYPHAMESISRLLIDKKDIPEKDSLIVFAKQLLHACNIDLSLPRQLDFVRRNYAAK